MNFGIITTYLFISNFQKRILNLVKKSNLSLFIRCVKMKVTFPLDRIFTMFKISFFVCFSRQTFMKSFLTSLSFLSPFNIFTTFWWKFLVFSSMFLLWTAVKNIPSIDIILLLREFFLKWISVLSLIFHFVFGMLKSV